MTKQERQALRVALVAHLPERTPLEAARKLHRMMAIDALLRNRHEPPKVVRLDQRGSTHEVAS